MKLLHTQQYQKGNPWLIAKFNFKVFTIDLAYRVKPRVRKVA